MTVDKSTRNSQCKKWEKERRGRLNESFETLAKLLPCYDPSVNISKIDILVKSAEYIKKLKGKVDDFVLSNKNSDSNPEVKEINDLNSRINNLLKRNEQLANLLKEAKITIPSECDVTTFAKRKKWSGKISKNKAEELKKLEEQKENSTSSSVLNAPKKKVKKAVIKDNKAKKRKPIEGKRVQKKGKNNASQSNVKVANVQPCFFIANASSNSQINPVQNSSIVPTVATAQTCKPIANNTILLPIQPPAVLSSPLILKATPPGTLLVVKTNQNTNKSVIGQLNSASSTTPASKTPPTKALIPLKPKRRVPKTIPSNKLPIPANRHSNNYIFWSNISVSGGVKTKKIVLNNRKRKKSLQKEAITAKKPKQSKSEEVDCSKKNNSDYSIDAICKEQEEPKGKDKVNKETIEKCPEEDISKEDEVEKAANVVQNATNAVAITSDEVTIPTTTLTTLTVTQSMEKEPAEKEKPVQIPETIHSELSNDIFATLQVQGNQNPESRSPTAAFLNAFPLVSSFTGVKVTEVIEEETSDSPHGTPTLLQIGTMEPATQKSSTQAVNDPLASSILNLDNFNFFGGNLYSNFEGIVSTTATTSSAMVSSSKTVTTDINVISKTAKILYDNALVETEYLKTSQNDFKCVPPTTLMNSSQKLVSSASAVTSCKQTFPSYSFQEPFYASTTHSTQVVNSTKPVVSTMVNIGTNSNTYNEYNTFNPFTDIPKQQQYSNNKTCGQSLYPNGNNNCNYNYQADFNSSTSRKYNNGGYYDNNQCSFYSGSNKESKSKETKTPVNWMTDYTTPKVTTYADFTQNSCYNLNSQPIYGSDYQSNVTNVNSNANGRELIEEQQQQQQQQQQFSWSPTKFPNLLEAPHNFPATTLPTLIGDLALGNTTNVNNVNDKKKSPKKQLQNTYDSNFLSVSQLVDHSSKERISSASRRNRNLTTKINNVKTSAGATCKRQQQKEKEAKVVQNKGNYGNTHGSNEVLIDWDRRSKNAISNYSAESLIGAKQQNYSSKSSLPHYLPAVSDNLITYFSPNLEDNFAQNNQNYHQSGGFGSNYNNTFIPVTPVTSTTTYLPGNNFLADLDYVPTVENIFSHSHASVKNSATTAGNKKSPQKYKEQYLGSSVVAAGSHKVVRNKKKDNFVDFGFLSMPPASINSPLLPDDFHSNFLPPPNPSTLYTSCKTPLYKQSSGACDLAAPILPLSNSGARGNQHAVEISPAPSSLTNFNLSTIFPEINKTSGTGDMLRNYIPTSHT